MSARGIGFGKDPAPSAFHSGLGHAAGDNVQAYFDGAAGGAVTAGGIPPLLGGCRVMGDRSEGVGE